jgi:hypothetical protein
MAGETAIAGDVFLGFVIRGGSFLMDMANESDSRVAQRYASFAFLCGFSAVVMGGRSSPFPQIRVCSSASKKGSRTPVLADVMGQCHFP